MRRSAPGTAFLERGHAGCVAQGMGEAPRGSGGGKAGAVAPPDGGSSAATAHEAPLALHELQVLELLDEQRRPDKRQPGPLDELVEAGRLPAECVEHPTLLVAGW